MRAPRVVVVGAGVSGLACAATLQAEAERRRMPLALTVVDASDAPGGHARTVARDGFLIERGPNGFLARDRETPALVELAGLTSRLVEANPASRKRFIVRDRRLCAVPDSPGAFVTSPALSWKGKLRLLAEPWASGPPASEETVYQFATRRIGAEAAEMLVDAAVSGISAGDSRALSVSAQFPMMTDMEREHGGLVRAMIARRSRRQGPSRLLSFDGGMGLLTGTLARRLGTSLRLLCPVRAVTRSADEWVLQLPEGATIVADHVVLATPARVSALLTGDLDTALAATLQDIPYSSLAVVALAYPTDALPRPLDGYGYLVTRPEGLATLGVLWESSIFPGRAPEGAALLRVFLGGARRPEVARLDEPTLVTMARDELAAVLGPLPEPTQSLTVRWPEAIAQYTLGHAGRVLRAAERLRAMPGLHVCGASYHGVSFSQAIASGRAVARLVETGLWAGHQSLASLAV
ncbi:MAG: protoporphyrinogen oxidase [Vicinamibacterales bacterium]